MAAPTRSRKTGKKQPFSSKMADICLQIQCREQRDYPPCLSTTATTPTASVAATTLAATMAASTLTTNIAATSTTTSIAATTPTACSFTFNDKTTSQGAIIQEYFGVTAEACQAYCAPISECDGVSFTTSNGQCALRMVGSVVVAAAIDWYQKSCA